VTGTDMGEMSDVCSLQKNVKKMKTKPNKKPYHHKWHLSQAEAPLPD